MQSNLHTTYMYNDTFIYTIIFMYTCTCCVHPYLVGNVITVPAHKTVDPVLKSNSHSTVEPTSAQPSQLLQPLKSISQSTVEPTSAQPIVTTTTFQSGLCLAISKNSNIQTTSPFVPADNVSPPLALSPTPVHVVVSEDSTSGEDEDDQNNSDIGLSDMEFLTQIQIYSHIHLYNLFTRLVSRWQCRTWNIVLQKSKVCIRLFCSR